MNIYNMNIYNMNIYNMNIYNMNICMTMTMTLFWHYSETTLLHKVHMCMSVYIIMLYIYIYIFHFDDNVYNSNTVLLLYTFFCLNIILPYEKTYFFYI